jgi:ATP-dependent Clp protease adapter protein ClpS
MEIIRECEERAKEEITRLIAAMATWQRKNPKQKVPANFLKNNQTYTINAFISEVMKSGFDAKYLSGRKLTNQVAKHGRNIKEPLHPDDVHAVIGFISFHFFFKCICLISFHFSHAALAVRAWKKSITFKEEGQSNRTSSDCQVDEAYLPLQQTGRKFTQVVSFKNG